MDTTALLEKPASKAIAANILLAALLFVWALPSLAGQSSGQFPVTINLQNNGNAPTGAAPVSVLCRSGTGIGAFGSTVTVACATGAATDATGNSVSKLPWTTMPDNSYRFMFGTYREGEKSGTVDSYNGAGTVASWRMVKLDNRDYIEMMLHW